MGETFDNLVTSAEATKTATLKMMDHPRDDTWAAEVEKVEAILTDEQTSITSTKE